MGHGGQPPDEDKIHFAQNQPVNNADQVIHGFFPLRSEAFAGWLGTLRDGAGAGLG